MIRLNIGEQVKLQKEKKFLSPLSTLNPNHHLKIFLFFFLNASLCMAKTITVYIQPKAGGKKVAIEIDNAASISELRKMVSEKKFNSTNLIYSNRPHSPLNDSAGLIDYNVMDQEIFFAEKLQVIGTTKAKQKAFYDAATGEDDNEKAVIRLLKTIPKDQRMDFLADYKEELDHNKIVLHRVARFGNIKVLKAIRKLLTKEEFQKLLTMTDNQGRTVFMFAAQAIKNVKKTVNYVAKYTPKEILKSKDRNSGKLTAFDWAVVRNVTDLNEKLLAELHETSGSSFAANLDFSSVCPGSWWTSVAKKDKLKFLKLISELSFKIGKSLE